MRNIFKKNSKETRSVEIPGIGTLFYLIWPEESFWMGNVNTIGSSTIELSIDTYNDEEPTEEQIKLIKELPLIYENYMNILYGYLSELHEDISLQDIQEMYFLAAVGLKRDCQTLIFTLEPHFNVKSIYNNFQRFSVVNGFITRYTEG